MLSYSIVYKIKITGLIKTVKLDVYIIVTWDYSYVLVLLFKECVFFAGLAT